MAQLRFLALLTLLIGIGPLAVVIAIEFALVALGASDDALGDYFVLAYVLLLAAGAWLFVRLDRQRTASVGRSQKV
jgi:hypothetical protein